MVHAGVSFFFRAEDGRRDGHVTGVQTCAPPISDKKRREEVELRKQADQLIFTTEKTIKDLGDKVSDAEKQKAEEAKEALKKALEGDDTEDIKAKKEALEQEVQQLSVKLYEQMAQEQGAQGAAGAEGDASGAADDDVVDAEYEEVDDDEKSDK